MKPYFKIILAVFSGILLTAAWPEKGFPLFLFLGFIPLLWIEYDHWLKRQENHTFGIFGYIFLAFLVFNSLTTYWIYNSTLVGAIAAVMLNSTFMTLVFITFHYTRRKFTGTGAGYLALTGYWLSFEYLHLRWDLNWPWLNLGNGFAAYPEWIQWYEFTGVFGGSLWVLLVNILLFNFFRIRFIEKGGAHPSRILIVSAIVILIVPVMVSYYMFHTYKEKDNAIDVVVVQPNLDPYSEQYDLDPMEVTERLLNLAGEKADSLTGFMVFPESALQEYAYEDNLEAISSIQKINEFNREHGNLAAIVGISTRKLFKEGEPLSPTARKFRDANRYYDAYNTALFVAPGEPLQVYHKSKLTPGVEKMPYPKLFSFLEKYAIDLGGTIGSLAVDKEQIPFIGNDSVSIAPIICYESVYGEFVNRFVQNGANVIFVITNDGWWGNTPGHRQHLLFSVLRAVETRRSIARSANTGISCFINQRGEIIVPTSYWQPDVIRQKINLNSKVTFYTRYGDYIGRILLLVAALMLLLTIANAFMRSPGKRPIDRLS